MTTTRVTTYLVCAGTTVLLSAAIGHAQITAHDHAAMPQEPKTAQGQATAGPHAMMADMQAAQKRLDMLVSEMNAATGPEKVDRIAAVVTEMAAMHKRMSGMMMQGGMMHMMQTPHGPAAKQP